METSQSENSQDYAQKPQQNCTFMNSAFNLRTLHVNPPVIFSMKRKKKTKIQKKENHKHLITLQYAVQCTVFKSRIYYYIIYFISSGPTTASSRCNRHEKQIYQSFLEQSNLRDNLMQIESEKIIGYAVFVLPILGDGTWCIQNQSEKCE